MPIIDEARTLKASLDPLSLSKMATPYDYDHSVPCELIRKILTMLMADSIQTICCSESLPAWEINVALTLSSVSFAFREIVLEVTIKAFEIPQPIEGAR